MVVFGGLVGRGGGLIHNASDKHKLIPGQMWLRQELKVSKPLSVLSPKSVFSSSCLEPSILGALMKLCKKIQRVFQVRKSQPNILGRISDG